MCRVSGYRKETKVHARTSTFGYFKPGDIRFTFRVGGILIQREHVLCQSAGEEGFWFLPGGRTEIGESARASRLAGDAGGTGGSPSD